MYLEIRKDGERKSSYLFKVLDRDLCNDFFFSYFFFFLWFLRTEIFRWTFEGEL